MCGSSPERLSSLPYCKPKTHGTNRLIVGFGVQILCHIGLDKKIHSDE
ncbi:hypothetical protein LEP1GSC202_0019 [Leptospira yanagawae serovar Saopaulo str. Sao Paulo = ATCC 700523]|uniref:Uncharacterized protein n=1 Tax=Leptospira yanagawae serovar Saopaulo str. Sao Paulo = ATCC 700523 TaxID=1249483 RepID=A0A5E8H7H8_9LEPT|nr:hypothetical protein LEP1GSC202_0019 [Leptospira yanagawae serovar Saopaulo str. Sao Paulo = ATCC 700523]